MKEMQYLDSLIERYPKLQACREDIIKTYEILLESFQSGKKLLVAGNGGSASDSEHIVGELMKSFVLPRKLPADSKQKLINANKELGSELAEKLQGALPLSTAYLNDVDPLLGFAQQVYGYGQEGDAFLGITTSGNSKNVLYACVAARAKGVKTIALTGRDGGKVKDLVDAAIVVPETETFKIQELHLPIYHALCLMLEEAFFEE